MTLLNGHPAASHKSYLHRGHPVLLPPASILQTKHHFPDLLLLNQPTAHFFYYSAAAKQVFAAADPLQMQRASFTLRQQPGRNASVRIVRLLMGLPGKAKMSFYIPD
ncbi:hypothetical protein [Dyadobacter sp. SG02]|uniref:hypothetical protein n=1 Tax=Dyadobacter sp. SG02 TaxID=1855291 RepID=UPI00115FF3C0|nr:hypothetical protein [Dyadobacter sp. SG02]